MRDPSVRLLLLVLLALSLASPALAQGNETPAGNATNGTTDANATPTGNDTATDNGTAAPPAEAAGPITIHLEAVQEGSATFFRDPATGAKNPTLTVQPGQHVTFKVKSVAGTHNLHLASGEKTAFISDGEDATLEWDAPATAGKVEYWCDPHKGGGMRGNVQVGGAAPPAGGESGAEGAIVGDAVDLGGLDAACAGKQAPAIVTTGVTGGPTLADYIQKCSQVGTEGPARAKSGADLVIPLSWGLIALGIVGVVWVHKYYKP